MTSLYTHDCDKCRFLGIDTPMPGEPKCDGVDMYVCKRILSTTVLRRYSSGPSHYTSVQVEVLRRYAGHFEENLRRIGCVEETKPTGRNTARDGRLATEHGPF